MNDLLAGIEQWCVSHCNGVWENSRGIRIETLDNSGWPVEIDLAGTSLAGLDFESVRIEGTDVNWLHAWFGQENLRLTAERGSLREILQFFIEWSRAVC